MLYNYLDYLLNPLVKYLLYFVRNSSDMVDTLKMNNESNIINNNNRILTADTISMYTKICSIEGISIISKYIELYHQELPPSSPPKEFITQLIELVMKYNIFRFGNTWWKQLIGTDMGTPCVCAYVILFVGLIERTHILPKYESRLKLYVRQIGDILVLWQLSEGDIEKEGY